MCLLNGSSGLAAEDRSVDLPLFETEAPSATTEPAVEISNILDLSSGSPEAQQKKEEKADADEPVAEPKPDLVDVNFYTLFLNRPAIGTRKVTGQHLAETGCGGRKDQEADETRKIPVNC